MKLKILIFALSGIGDALMFTPALVKLREHFTGSQIDVMVMFKGTKDIYENLNFISNVHYYDFINSKPFSAIRYLLKFRNKYDITINVYPSNRKEYNIINFLAGASKRAGVRYLRKDFVNLGFLNNLTIKEKDTLHNVEENIKLIEKITGNEIQEIPPLQLEIGQNEMDFGKDYLKQLKINDDDLLIGFHPGCATLKNHINRRWEPEKFIELGRKLIAEKSAKIFLFGGPEEKGLKHSIASGINSDSVISVLTDSLLQSIAVMKRCGVFVTNDSALMHVAAALKLKTVSIIGPTNINYIRPWQTEHKIATLNLDCAPCFYYSPKPLTCTRNDVQYKCVKELDVDMVYHKVSEFIN
ncbi:glycosyltransferase family 9 protein [Bacteroidota bacterium]